MPPSSSMANAPVCEFACIAEYNRAPFLDKARLRQERMRAARRFGCWGVACPPLIVASDQNRAADFASLAGDEYVAGGSPSLTAGATRSSPRPVSRARLPSHCLRFIQFTYFSA